MQTENDNDNHVAESASACAKSHAVPSRLFHLENVVRATKFLGRVFSRFGAVALQQHGDAAVRLPNGLLRHALEADAARRQRLPLR